MRKNLIWDHSTSPEQSSLDVFVQSVTSKISTRRECCISISDRHLCVHCTIATFPWVIFCQIMMHDFGHVMQSMATSGATWRKQGGLDACGPCPYLRSWVKTWWTVGLVNSDLYLISSISVLDCRHKNPAVTTSDWRACSQITNSLIHCF